MSLTILNEDELVNRPSPNYTPGREGTPVRHVTFHHAVGSAESAVSRFLDPTQYVSAHFIVGANVIYCCVNTDDTAWTNGNWASNLESVTIEHEGDWRNGFYSQPIVDNSARLVAWLRSLYPSATPNRHRDLMATACPGDLPVEKIWSMAGEILSPPVIVPTPTPIPAPPPVPAPIPAPVPGEPPTPEPAPAPSPPGTSPNPPAPTGWLPRLIDLLTRLIKALNIFKKG